MRFPDIQRGLGGELHARGGTYDSADVENVTAGDLMSEVLVFEMENLLLVTALNSEQALRTASMVDALGVVLVNGKAPGPKMVALADELEIALLSTPLSMFEACAELHRLLAKGR